MIDKIFKALFGTYHERELKRIQPYISKINSIEAEIKKLSDQYDKELQPYKQAVEKVLENLRKTLDGIFADLSKKEGYIAVLTKSIQGQEVVLWGGVDITDRVIKLLSGK
ncbi:MAG: hypothetical protein ACK4SU_01940 [Dictyoglomus sp.]